ncbi:MAG: 3-oxoacyl-[acyl-carrier-protein] reductase [Bacteroidales bacterium]|jgi:3-oxoacyl-[acyl-carrier protein] reductase|nr:3-oxoacyl-[acyl-carrier-protein] reductase [Bacteroidales bacterium]MDI9575975.1 3-oxoacyl-[acyl-carrier-protein] reductase [Bacteroidota bacterium]MDD3754995.1 3-oxoacyl-[acyl-carrier-protein] reductase [Bacteroidales bacterium]MDY0400185.1 3-oxoacyl-[acyl-carrier-protein] reductase [Bacteroidales bacterium]HHW60092.1 3-oxoacyl-[acyl-carrier-protein] reductase [Bacteroidales bacterium]
MKLLENKTAVITGAARGIGRAIAEKFASNGANVAITDLNINEEVEKFIDEIQKKYNIKAKAYAFDVSDLNACQDFVEKLLQDFTTIDILVNNAGITRDNLLLRMSEQDWDLVIKVNLKSVFNMTKVLLQHFMRNRSGSIINMASVVGVAGNAGQANYSASKAGIIGFTKSIAQEVGSRNIRCNAIAPGFIETPMTAQLPDEVRKDWMQKIPLRRGGTPDDVANIALFLASELSSYVSGQVINVCGGMRM